MTQTVKSYEPNMPTLDVSEVIELERKVADAGTSLLTLMTRAGAAVAQIAREMLDELDTSDKRVVILAGSGNNGGDGWVAASDLAAEDYDVVLVSKAPAEELTAEPARTSAIEAARNGGFQIVLSPDDGKLAELLNDADLIIDAILGTGFAHSDVRAPYCDWIDLANTARSERSISILAVDCPSGLNAQTGSSAANCIDADTTVTMIAAKTGLTQKSARAHVGELLIAPIGIKI